MPLYLKNKILFLHIPKTGGTSVEHIFRAAGDEMVFYSDSHMINDHSPQHTTYAEFSDWHMVPADFRIATIVRHPYDRFVSEYNYVNYEREPEPLGRFSERFMNGEGWWDRHNKSCCFFLDGCAQVEVIRFENLYADFKRVTGLDFTHHEMRRPTIITRVDLTMGIKEMLQELWKDDFLAFGYDK